MDDKKRFGKQYGYEVLFKTQPRHASGKTGVIIGEMGMPEEYDIEFYNYFMEHVFNYSLPSILKPLVLADKGIGLIDPDNPMAREAYKPRQLVDPLGSFTNKAGISYADCKVKWVGPNKKNPWDHGYFLYSGDGPSGRPDVCDKVGAKIIGWYYGRLLPEKKVPLRYQLRKIFEGSVAKLEKKYPAVEFRSAYYMYPDTVHKAVEELIAAGCETIVYQGINCPLYTDFEDYGYVLMLLHKFAAGRAKIILADQLGNQPAYRQAYFEMLRDQLKEIPQKSSVLVIACRHGHPFKKETQAERAHLYCQPLEAGLRQVMAEWKGKWELIWSADEYADDYWDKTGMKYETYAAYRKAIEEGFDYAIELPVEFPAENTDLMIFHAMKKFGAFAEYDRYAPVSYPDWEKPLVRKFKEGKTTGIYAGTPTGPYRKHLIEAVVASISQVLDPA